jgi:DNA-binding NarL/FixJ family response regulator
VREALKGISGSELAEIIRSVHAAQPYIAPALSAQLRFQRASKSGPRISSLTELSHRERQVLAGVGKGLTVKEIANTLNIKPSTN